MFRDDLQMIQLPNCSFAMPQQYTALPAALLAIGGLPASLSNSTSGIWAAIAQLCVVSGLPAVGVQVTSTAGVHSCSISCVE